MSDYRQRVREFTLTSRNVLDIKNLSDDETKVLKEALARVSALIADSKDSSRN